MRERTAGAKSLLALLSVLTLLVVAGLGAVSPRGVSALNSTSTTLTSTPDPSVFGQAKTLTATVTCGGPIPSGTADFFDGATLLGTSALDGSGVATFTTSSLGIGSHNLTATYNSDSNCDTSTSPIDSQTVAQASTSTALTSAPDPSVFGESKTLTATVTAVPPGSGTATGTVDFFDGATLLGTASLAGGVGTFTTSALAVGSHALTAVYSGDTNFTGSTSPVDTQTVNQAATSTALTSAPDPSVFGETKTLTATVTAVPPGSGVPTGTVSFFDGATLLGTASIAGGVGTFTTSNLSVGSHALTAVYGGDTNFTGSVSPVDTQTVTQAATTTTLTSAPDPSVLGMPKVLTATVTAVPPGSGTPTGNVDFFDGATLLGTNPLSGGVATLVTSTLSVGSHNLTAVYSGDANFSGSTSPVDTQTVSQSASTTVLTSAPDPSMFGQAKTLTATVTAVPPGSGTPTGIVNFFDGATQIGSGTLSGGVATLTTTTLAGGSHSLTAVYGGDLNFTSSTSPIDTQTVTQASTTVVLTSAPDPSTFGQVKTLTATVTCPGGATGTVSFFDGATLLGTGTLSSGVATFPISTLAVGSHSLTAVYSGDANCTGSTSPVDTQIVNPATTTTTLTAVPSTFVTGQPVTLTATVGCGAVTPTGIVTFLDGALPLGAAPLNGSGQATLLLPGGLSTGAHALSANYSGDANCLPSTGSLAATGVVPVVFANHPSYSPAPSQPAPYGGNGADPRCYYTNCSPNGLP
jgi:hypothetical protein